MRGRKTNSSDSITIRPRKVDLAFRSNVPGGVSFAFDQSPRQGAFVIDTAVGFQHTVAVPESVIANGEQWVFESWSTGATTSALSLTVPAADESYTANYVSLGQPTRVKEGQQLLYTFDVGAGGTVFDVSGVGEPLNLTIGSLENVTWSAGQLTVESPTRLEQVSQNPKLFESISTSNEITIEAWIAPKSVAQTGPARIVTMSDGVAERNFTLGQEVSGNANGEYDVRLRTTTTGFNGVSPSLTSSGNVVSENLTHAVYTRASDGTANLYVDNSLVASGIIAGDFANWNPEFLFGLANETSGDRPWLGTFDLVAVYDRALTTPEVEQNFHAGPGVAPSATNIAPLAADDEYSIPNGGTLDTVLDFVPTLIQNDSDPNLDRLRAVLVSEPSNAVDFRLNEDGSFLYTHDGSATGVDSFTYQVDDGTELSNVATVTINVVRFNETPEANAGGPYTTETGNLVTLDGSLSRDPDGDPLDFAWDFDNDGEFDDATTPVASFVSLVAGVFDVSLLVVDSFGAFDIVTAQVTVQEKPRVIGDVNRDGVFDSADLVIVLQVGEYQDDIDGNSTFEEGDWNGDGDFDSSDFVFAFQSGRYLGG